jgi:hypothetical protein
LPIQRKFNVAVEQFIWQVANEIPIQGDTGYGKKKKKKRTLTLVTEARETTFAC